MGRISGIASGWPAGGEGHRALAEDVAGLGWEALRLGGAHDPAFPAVEVDFAFAHPRLGIALVDLHRPSPEPVRRLRARLRALGFSEAFPTHLPIIHRVLTVADLWRLSLVLDPVFASQPPLGPVGRDWIVRVQRALLWEGTEATTAAEVIASSVEPARRPPEASTPVEEAAAEADHEAQIPVETAEVRESEAAPEALAAPLSAEEPRAVSEAEPVAPASSGTSVEVMPTRAKPTAAATSAGDGWRGFWMLLAAGIAAGLGASHHITLPEGWTARLLSLEVRRPAEPPGAPVAALAAAPRAIGQQLQSPQVSVLQARE